MMRVLAGEERKKEEEEGGGRAVITRFSPSSLCRP